MPSAALGMLLDYQAYFFCQLGNKVLVVCREQGVEKLFDDGVDIVRASNDEQKV